MDKETQIGMKDGTLPGQEHQSEAALNSTPTEDSIERKTAIPSALGRLELALACKVCKKVKRTKHLFCTFCNQFVGCDVCVQEWSIGSWDRMWNVGHVPDFEAGTGRCPACYTWDRKGRTLVELGRLWSLLEDAYFALVQVSTRKGVSAGPTVHGVSAILVTAGLLKTALVCKVCREITQKEQLACTNCKQLAGCKDCVREGQSCFRPNKSICPAYKVPDRKGRVLTELEGLKLLEEAYFILRDVCPWEPTTQSPKAEGDGWAEKAEKPGQVGSSQASAQSTDSDSDTDEPPEPY